MFIGGTIDAINHGLLCQLTWHGHTDLCGVHCCDGKFSSEAAGMSAVLPFTAAGEQD
jgi:hypothetical protein